MNDLAGRLISVLTFIPFDQWRRNHSMHHSTSGNLDRRGVGDVRTLTIDEYFALPILRRFVYRAYRNPAVMFGLGGIGLILLGQRIPFGRRGSTRGRWMSSQLTNLAIALSVGAVCWNIGSAPFIKTHAPVFLVYTAVGIWLFVTEHQFENTYWRNDSEWDFYESAIAGSSYLALPRPLQWLTASIGIHHVHHLNPRIPNYRLQGCVDANPVLATANKISLRESLRSTRLALWDPIENRLVGFRGAATSRAHSVYSPVASSRQATRTQGLAT